MSPKAFDILPPYPKEEPRTYHHHTADKTKKEKNKSKHNFLIFVFGLFFILVLFSFVKLENFNGNILGSNSTNKPQSTDATSSTGTSQTETQFELFDNQGQSNLTETQLIAVRLLDGATKTENLDTIKNLLLQNDYIIEKQDKATNLYSQTVIYYKKGQLAQGQAVSNILKSNFSPLLSESSGLDKTYDLLVIVGDK